jgi:xylulokinase
MFFNIRLETGKTELIRAVIEGICFHLKWMLECADKKVKSSQHIRFVGGGALSPVTCQILSDILGRRIETVPDPQDVGSVGAAAVACQGLGYFDHLDDVRKLIPVTHSYEPTKDPDIRKLYDRNYQVFKRLYENNRKNFSQLNG